MNSLVETAFIAACSIATVALCLARRAAAQFRLADPSVDPREIAHDIRNPLTVLQTTVSSLVRNLEHVAPDELEAIHRIQRCTDHVVSILDHFLDKPQRVSEAIPTVVAVAPVIQQVCDVVKPSADLKSISLCVAVPDGLCSFVDVVHLRQMLFNLLHNAVKFSPQETRVRITATAFTDTMCIEVRNTVTGLGIQEADAERGYGIGLSVTKRLAKLAGGDIRVFSTPDFGVTVTLTLPNETVANHKPLTGKQCLVLNVGPSNAAAMLETLGAVVQRADEVTTALEALVAQRFDLVLIDDDFEPSSACALAKIIKNDLDAKSTRVMMVTPTKIDSETAQEFGVDACIVSPLSRAEAEALWPDSKGLS